MQVLKKETTFYCWCKVIHDILLYFTKEMFLIPKPLMLHFLCDVIDSPNI